MTPSELKTIRLSLGLSQQQLAERLGYKHYTTVLRWELGKNAIPKYVILAINNLKKGE